MALKKKTQMLIIATSPNAKVKRYQNMHQNTIFGTSGQHSSKPMVSTNWQGVTSY